MKQITMTMKTADIKEIPTSLSEPALVQALVSDTGCLIVRFNRGEFGAGDPMGLIYELHFNNLETGKIRSALLKGAV